MQKRIFQSLMFFGLLGLCQNMPSYAEDGACVTAEIPGYDTCEKVCKENHENDFWDLLKCNAQCATDAETNIEKCCKKQCKGKKDKKECIEDCKMWKPENKMRK